MTPDPELLQGPALRSVVQRDAGAVPPIRVVHLVTTLNIGGLEMVVYDLIRAGRQHGVEGQVICLGEVGALAPRFSALGIPVESLRADRLPRVERILRLARRFRQLRPDVVHTHNPGPHLHGVIAGRLARVPVLVHTKHGRNFPGVRKAVLFNRLLSSLTDCVVAVSEDAAAVALEVERVAASRVRVIHNGIDLEGFPFRGARKARRGWRAITVARLDPVKDQATMLRALQSVVGEGGQVTLDVVGDGPSRQQLEELSAALGLQGNVTFHGYQQDIPSFLRQADYFLLSSKSEGISLTLLEAMAVGLPVVATDVGGNREVVAPGATGYLVQPESPAALADGMLSMHKNEGRLVEMSRACRERVEEAFDLRVTARGYHALYLEALARRGRSLPEWR